MFFRVIPIPEAPAPMNRAFHTRPQLGCSVCGSRDHAPFITTGTMMHEGESADFRFNRCAVCDTVFLTNPVVEGDLGAFYTEAYLPYRGETAWGRYAGWVRRDDERLNAKRVGWVRRFLPRDAAEAAVLDIGCGKPDFLAKLKATQRVHAVGIDRTAAQWGDSKYSSLELIEGDWRELKTERQFDVLTAWHYLEHDYHLSATERACHQLLKPGGVLIAEVPLYQGLLQRLQGPHWQGWHTPRHLTLFSVRSWKHAFPEDRWNHLEHRTSGTLSAFTLWWLGHHEKRNGSWSGSMEPHFWGLVFWKVALAPLFLLERFIPLGIQTVVLQKKAHE